MVFYSTNKEVHFTLALGGLQNFVYKIINTKIQLFGICFKRCSIVIVRRREQEKGFIRQILFLIHLFCLMINSWLCIWSTCSRNDM